MGHSQSMARLKYVLALPLKTDTLLISDTGRGSAIVVIRIVGFGPSLASWLDPPLTAPPGWQDPPSAAGDSARQDRWLAVDGFAICHI